MPQIVQQRLMPHYETHGQRCEAGNALLYLLAAMGMSAGRMPYANADEITCTACTHDGLA